MTGKKFFVMAAVVLMSVSGVWAEELTFTPNPSDLNDLDHTKVYRWGFDVTLPEGETVTSASLTLSSISNWDNNPNVLYIHLLDWTERGVKQSNDNEGGGDYFALAYTGTQTPLVTYQNLTTTPQTLVYSFTSGQLATLNGYLADGRVGLGFDPDCHFYNNGARLQLITPEPATLALLLGAIPLTLRRRAKA
jgi:hypothetical protein